LTGVLLSFVMLFSFPLPAQETVAQERGAQDRAAQDRVAQESETRTTRLTTSTDRCVALQRGQMCYKKITLTWQAPTGSYCLHNVNSDAPLQCWQQQASGELNYEFSSADDTTFELRRENSNNPIASATVTVAWVYEPKPKQGSGWRIF